MRYPIIIFMAITCTILASGQVPKGNEWVKQKKTQRKYMVKQIAALQIFMKSAKKGYEIANKGLSLISEVKGGTASMDIDHFNSLKQVNPLIKNSPKAKDILAYRVKIEKSFKQLIEFCSQSDELTAVEFNYVKLVANGMRTQGKSVIAELTLITNTGAEMTDDERLLRLSKAHEEMQEQFKFTKSFIASTKRLCIQRAKERHETGVLNDLFKP